MNFQGIGVSSVAILTVQFCLLKLDGAGIFILKLQTYTESTWEWFPLNSVVLNGTF